MKYKRTEYEYKNLGVSSCEIVLDKNDTIEEFQKLDSNISEEYRVLKISTNIPHLLFGLAKLGYIYVETQIILSLKKVDFCPIAVINPSYKKIQWEEFYNPENVEQLAFIKDGNTFLTDRIAIDPAFGRKIAGQRYFNWFQDICRKGGSIVLAKVDEHIIGCTSVEINDEKVCYLALGGMMASPFEEAYYACIDAMERYAFDKLGARRLELAVSSNNLPILRLDEKKGYHVKGMCYVYIKHTEGISKSR